MVGICSVAAQDLIILKDGNIIESKVMEISPTEIRYKRFDHLDGPTIVIPAANVLSIRYENGTYEIINAGNTANTATDPNKLRFGINANAGGALGYIWGGPTGFGINIELGKGRFNSEINLMFPTGGFGALVTFNGFWPSQIGGFYLGGGIGFSFYQAYAKDKNEFYTAFSLQTGLNIGYKFVTKSGLYFRTGAFAGVDFFNLNDAGIPIYFKPDLAIGWTMR
jgi:hypothetical protein